MGKEKSELMEKAVRLKDINDRLVLNNGVEIPCVAFGTYKAAQGNSADVISTAIAEGYRYFDTASFYETEGPLGEAIKESGLSREEFFIASKVWKDEMGYENTKLAFERTLKKLGTDYLDLYLIHWPRPSLELSDWRSLDRETWRAMEELYKEGKIRAIGLSNFLPHHIENILAGCSVVPAVNQLELHVGYMQCAATEYCRERGIQLQAWSPIGRSRVLEEPLVKELSEKYGVSSARLCLRFLLQMGIIPLPKSSSAERMRENRDIFSFNISDEDMMRLLTIPQTGWSGEHPDRERVYF